MMIHKSPDLRASLLLAGLFWMCSIQAQNLVTFMPPDPAKTPPPADIDTVITIIDAQTDHKRVTLLEHNITVRDGFYMKGKKTGRWTDYSDTGVLLQIADYENDQKSGEYMEFDVNGALVVWEHYRNGQLHGERKYYVQGKNGRVLKSAYNYADGQLDGLCSEYTAEGKLQSQNTYAKGKKNGMSTWYFSNGKMAMMQYYKNDALEGNQKIYNQQGILITDGNYVNNMRQGAWTEYYDSGKLKAKGNYSNDKKSGTWTYYDEAGNLVKTENL